MRRHHALARQRSLRCCSSDTLPGKLGLLTHTLPSSSTLERPGSRSRAQLGADTASMGSCNHLGDSVGAGCAKRPQTGPRACTVHRTVAAHVTTLTAEEAGPRKDQPLPGYSPGPGGRISSGESSGVGQGSRGQLPEGEE